MSKGYTIEGAEGVKDSDSGEALLVEADEFEDEGFGNTKWIPHSQIHEDSEVYKPGTSGDLIVTEWLAEQNGWL